MEGQRRDQAVNRRQITATEKADQAAKTARLREARLAKEAADRLANAPGEPAKAGKR